MSTLWSGLVPEWVDFAVCPQTDPEVFVPAVGSIPTAAKKVCSVCPVVSECLDWALGQSERVFGVWGGTTEAERRRMLSAARRAAA